MSPWWLRWCAWIPSPIIWRLWAWLQRHHFICYRVECDKCGVHWEDH